MVSSPRAELVLRLHFEAEHSNVLVVTAELLNGCLAHTEVDDLKLELIPDNYPHMPVRKRRGLGSGPGTCCPHGMFPPTGASDLSRLLCIVCTSLKQPSLHVATIRVHI